MGNRIFSVVVLLLWAASMSWLVADRILPSFLYGDPPSMGSVHQRKPVAWRVECDSKQVGVAVGQTVPSALGTTEVHSRVIFGELPLKDMAPQWMSAIVDRVGALKFDIRSRLTLDSLRNLSSFETRVKLNDMPTVIRMRGRAEDSALKVRVYTGDVAHEASYPLPKTLLLGGELTPDAKLLQLYVGRQWQKEIYSPFRPPNHSVEIVQAEVVCEEQLLFNGEILNTKRVEYRALDSTGVSGDDALRAVLWVAEDGNVLRQEIQLMNVRLRFERMLDESSLAEAEKLLNLLKYATATKEPI